MSAPPYSIAILGNDAFLAAAPAHPVQLLHAALAAGFDAVVPASLGDELVAGETLRLAQLRGRRPVVQCSCPFALSQLCKREANLDDVTVAVAPAPVALARALRLQRTDVTHLTYVGACPSGQDPAIDLQVLPEAFLRGLPMRGIVLMSQPTVFDDRLPPDRRRFLSLPGGAPRPDLVDALLRRQVVTLGGRQNPLLAVADALFDGGPTLIDPAGAYRCVCTGADGTHGTEEGRAAIAAIEPLRALSPIFEAPAWLDLRPTEDSHSADTPGGDQAPAPVAFHEAARIEAAPAVAPGSAAGRPAAAHPRTVMEGHVPPTSPSLHARPIERVVSIGDRRDPVADRVVAPESPLPAPRPVTLDDLRRRD
ncbi:MAG: hypothetical protein IT355_04910 [Gemmatimonadaceae bacterium]|nr:hypothetical protein [Gemmatimonadaceae bacterium]